MPVSVTSRFDDPLEQAPGFALLTVITSEPPVESGSSAPATGAAAQAAIRSPGAPNRPGGSDCVNAAAASALSGDQVHTGEPAALPPASAGAGALGRAASACPPAASGAWAADEPAALRS